MWHRPRLWRWPHGRPRMATRSFTDGHTVVLRTARCSPFKPSTDGGSSEAGRRRYTIVHQNGSEGRLLQVVYGWPTGRLRMAQPVHDGCRWTRQCGRPWRLHSCHSSTRLSTPLLAQRQIWSASSGKPASPMFVAALFVVVLLCRLRYPRKLVEIPQLQFLARLFTCPLLFHRSRQCRKPSRIPWRFNRCRSWTELLTCPLFLQRLVPMVLTVQRPVEIPQVHFLDKFVDISVVVV